MYDLQDIYPKVNLSKDELFKLDDDNTAKKSELKSSIIIEADNEPHITSISDICNAKINAAIENENFLEVALY